MSLRATFECLVTRRGANCWVRGAKYDRLRVGKGRVSSSVLATIAAYFAPFGDPVLAWTVDDPGTITYRQ